MQVNVVAQRVRQLTHGAPPRVKTNSRRPSAIALMELRAGQIEVYHSSEAEALLADAVAAEESDPAALEAAEAIFTEEPAY